MQTTMIVSVLQDIALVLFCLGLVLGVAKPSRRVVSDVAVHAGVALLAAACAISDGEVCSRAIHVFVVAMQFSLLQLTHRTMPLWAPGPAPFLLRAVEATLALTGASQGGPIGCSTSYTSAFLATLLVFSACGTSILSRQVHSFLSRDDGLPMVVLALVLMPGIMVESLHFVALIPAVFGTHVSETDFAWLALFAALSASQSLYDRGAHGGGCVPALVVLALPAVVACCLTYLGDLAAGVSLALASCCVMVRCGRTPHEVCLAALSGIALPLLASAFVPNMSGCWGAWLAGGDVFTFDGVSVRGWMGHVLLCYGAPGAVCVVVLTSCAILAGVRSIIGDDGTGVMVPFLCVTWSVELAIDALGTVWAIPPFFSCLVPFSGVTTPLRTPLLSGLAVAIAMSCDLRVAEMVADDPGIAWRFGVAGANKERCEQRLLPESVGGERR